MRLRLAGVLKNPITIIGPIVVLLVVGWQQYTYAGRALSVPAPGSNLLANGTFERIESGGLPEDWQVRKSGNLAYDVGYEDGYVAGKTLNLKVTSYSNGDLTLASPKVRVEPRQTYLFKGYYRSDTSFTLLVRMYQSDGTTHVRYIRDYSTNPDVWSTTSDAFASGDTIVAVQYIYKLASVGRLSVNGAYLEPRRDVYVSSEVRYQNILPNSELTVNPDTGTPDYWSSHKNGDNDSSFDHVQEDNVASLRVRTQGYKNGEAKWQFAPLPVSHQYYYFGVSYRSDAVARVVAEYETSDGRRTFSTLTLLAPSGEWTDEGCDFEVPSGVQTMTISAVLNTNGTLSTRQYVLADITKPGVSQWSRPLVSLAFDDGWQSAYDHAVPLLNHYGLRATFYVNPASIETPNFMTAAELRALQGAGSEIAAHGYTDTDLTAIDVAELRHQLLDGRDYLRKAGYTATSLATPYGNSDAEVSWQARTYYDTVRGTENGINTKQNLDPYNLKVLYVDVDTTNQAIDAALERAKHSNGWLIMVYHKVGSELNTPEDRHATVSTAAFAAQLKRLQQSGITVLPVATAYSEVRSQ